MKLKKQMIQTSLLAFGLSMGVGLTGAPSALAAPPNEENVQVQRSNVYQELVQSETFKKFRNINWDNEKENPIHSDIKLFHDTISSKVYNFVKNRITKEDFVKYDKLSQEEREKLLGSKFVQVVKNQAEEYKKYFNKNKIHIAY